MNLSVLLGLWLSVLASLAGSSAGPRAADARAERAAEASVRRSERSPVHDAIRLTRVVAGVAPASGAPPVTHATPAAALGSPPPRAEALPGGRDRARALRASHAVAARGAVLPYFATAPPLQG